MPAPTINIYEAGAASDPSLAFVGGWTTDTSANHSGGDAKKTTGSGDTVTWTSPVPCRAIYLVHAVVNAGSIFGVSVDGVSQAGQFSNATAGSLGSGGYYRWVTPLYRSSVD